MLHVIERCRGGVETYVADVLRRQRASGLYGAIELVADPAYVTPDLVGLADRALTYRSGRKPHGILRAALELRSIVAGHAPDLVHLHSSYPGVYGRMFASARPTAPAIVYCPHGWSFEMDVAPLKRRAFRAAERSLIHKTDMLIAVSRHEYRGGLMIGAPDAGHMAIPHGVAPPKSGPAPDGFDPNCLNFLFVGRFGRQKGLDLLLAAFAQTRREDIRLHVLGGPDDGINAQPNTGDSRILVHGWIEHEEIDAWYAAADALVVPSRWEGFGLVAAEAMRNQLAVLASIRGALPEVLGYGAAGRLFDPEDAMALGQLIDGFDRETLQAIGRAGHARYRALYSEERAAHALDVAYEHALVRRRARR